MPYKHKGEKHVKHIKDAFVWLKATVKFNKLYWVVVHQTEKERYWLQMW